MTLIDWLLTVTVVIPTTVWIALAVHYHARQPWLRYVASLVPIAIVAVSFATLPLVPWVLTVWLGLFVVAIVWWLSLRPRSDREWAAGMDVLPQAEVCGDILTVRNFRKLFTRSGFKTCLN